jgi:mRNA interferase MazF
MKFDAGSLVLIPFPFSDLKSQKKRPVLMLTDPDGFGDFICLAITSKGYHANAVALAQDEMKDGVLPKSSWIRTDKVFTLSRDFIVHAVGRVSEKVMDQAIKGLCGKISP